MKLFAFRIIVVVLLSVLVFPCCSTTMNLQGMNIKNNNNSGKILNLRNYGDFHDSLLKKSEKIMKSGYLNTSTVEYGYYEIDWGYSYNEHNSYFSNMAYMFAFVFTTPLIFVGLLPVGEDMYNVAAHFRIFDSNGNLVWQNKKNESLKKIVGLYNRNPTGKGERVITKLINEQLIAAANDADIINAKLEAAGPITDANSAPALEKITVFNRN